jgi:hypothetical protein
MVNQSFIGSVHQLYLKSYDIHLQIGHNRNELFLLGIVMLMTPITTYVGKTYLLFV